MKDETLSGVAGVAGSDHPSGFIPHPSDDGLEDLRGLQASIAGASESPWQPRCVAEAFRSRDGEHPFVFTMQVWIDLDAVESPFLAGRLPDPEMLEYEDIRQIYDEAFTAFGCSRPKPDCTAGQFAFFGDSMIRAVRRGFAMRLRMKPPRGFESGASDDGFGDWLPVMACLKAQLFFTWTEARMLPVEAAFGLINAHRRNEGWTPAETSYAMRGEG
ncbi:MAG TPA: hypothetical protein VHY22_13520 [Chthoniobacteraceae bacterium]|jgi:hypothetical protein|nr:hypothetical protein [Chthoniobacteraceae bacterium]